MLRSSSAQTVVAPIVEVNTQTEQTGISPLGLSRDGEATAQESKSRTEESVQSSSPDPEEPSDSPGGSTSLTRGSTDSAGGSTGPTEGSISTGGAKPRARGINVTTATEQDETVSDDHTLEETAGVHAANGQSIETPTEETLSETAEAEGSAVDEASSSAADESSSSVVDEARPGICRAGMYRIDPRGPYHFILQDDLALNEQRSVDLMKTIFWVGPRTVTCTEENTLTQYWLFSPYVYKINGPAFPAKQLKKPALPAIETGLDGLLLD